MHDHDDWDPDITGDPVLDQFGYESPRRSFHPVRWDAVAQLRQQQERQRDEWRRQREGEAGAAAGGQGAAARAAGAAPRAT